MGRWEDDDETSSEEDGSEDEVRKRKRLSSNETKTKRSADRPCLPLPSSYISRIRSGGSPWESLRPASQPSPLSFPELSQPPSCFSLPPCGAYPLYRCFRRCCWFFNKTTNAKKNTIPTKEGLVERGGRTAPLRDLYNALASSSIGHHYTLVS